MLTVNFASATPVIKQPGYEILNGYMAELAKQYFMTDRTANDVFFKTERGIKFFTQWVQEQKGMLIEAYEFHDSDGYRCAYGFHIHHCEALTMELLKAENA